MVGIQCVYSRDIQYASWKSFRTVCVSPKNGNKHGKKMVSKQQQKRMRKRRLVTSGNTSSATPMCACVRTNIQWPAVLTQSWHYQLGEQTVAHRKAEVSVNGEILPCKHQITEFQGWIYRLFAQNLLNIFHRKHKEGHWKSDGMIHGQQATKI